MPEPDYYTSESDGKVGSIKTVEQARAAHHLASADPEVDGTLTGPQHERKYALERAANSEIEWAAVHPETTDAPAAPETVTPPAVQPTPAPAA